MALQMKSYNAMDVRTVRADLCDLSLFQLGLRLLEHFLDYNISIPVTFQLVNPLEQPFQGSTSMP